MVEPSTIHPPENSFNERLLVVITGPTAVGKTAVAIEAASHFHTEIVSCDSRQMYREMRIGTAVPSFEQLSVVPHHFIGNLSIIDYYNVSMFEVEALSLLEQLFKKHSLVILTGGSGLYLDALCFGIDNFPSVDQTIRLQVSETFREEGIEGLRNRLRILDPVQFEQMDNRNKQRLMKALEVCLQTGKPYSSFLSGTKRTRPFRTLRIGLETDRERLYEAINARVDQMMLDGLLEEAKALYAYRKQNALKTVGYRELFDYMDGTTSLPEAIDLIKRNTRHYAKRQLTWFRRDTGMKWFKPSEQKEIIQYLDTFRPSTSPTP